MSGLISFRETFHPRRPARRLALAPAVEAQYRRLFADHGFRLTRVIPTDNGIGISVIEAVPA